MIFTFIKLLIRLQTLTALDLSMNAIGLTGVKFLVDALVSNTVREFFYQYISHLPSLFITDTQNVGIWTKPIRLQYKRIFIQRIAKYSTKN